MNIQRLTVGSNLKIDSYLLGNSVEWKPTQGSMHLHIPSQMTLLH
ncbi:hypothetical protein [Nostoc sp.]